MNGRKFLPVLIVAVSCLGCGEQSKTQVAPAPIPSVPSTSASTLANSAEVATKSDPASNELKFEGIQFTLPAGWKQVAIPPEKQGFIDGQVTIPSKGGELTLTFSSIGGGIDANVARWKAQFASTPEAPAVVEPLDLAGHSATWVDLRGEFRSMVGRSSGPQANQRMLGVGIPLQPRDFYLKLIGPADGIEEIREEFRNFVKSARFAP